MKVGKIKFSDIVGMLERDEMKEILGGSGFGSGYYTGNSLLNSNGGGGGSGGGTGGIGSTFASMGFGGGTAIGSSIGGQSYSGYSSPVTNSYYTSSGSSSGTSNNGTSNASSNNAWNNTSSGTTTNNPVAISRFFDFIYANNGIVNSSQINSFIANESTAAGQVANNQLYGTVLNSVNVVNNYHGPSTIPQGIVINNGMVQINNTANVNNSGGIAPPNVGGSEPIPWYRRWYGEQAKAWQWYSAAGVYDDVSFNAAALYCTKNLKSSPFQDITQRNAYYDWADSKLTNSSKWFGAAEIVTSWRAVGAADGVNFWFLDGAAEKFLQAGNAYLFDYNMVNAKTLIETGKLTGSFINANGSNVVFNGLAGKTLDYAMVQYEQTKVQYFIGQYQKNNPTANMNDIFKTVNASMGSSFAPEEVVKVMKDNFNNGTTFNFANYNDRVLLGQKIIDQLYGKK